MEVFLLPGKVTENSRVLGKMDVAGCVRVGGMVLDIPGRGRDRVV